VINGAGSAGIAIAQLLLSAGYKDIVLLSIEGVVCQGETWMNDAQKDIAEVTNLTQKRGGLDDVIQKADVFIGVSAPNVLNESHVKAMSDQPIIFALANPIPEIFPEKAIAAGAAVVGTGRSDYPNQINNLLAFPGIFRGILNARKQNITTEMKVAAAQGIANVISESELSKDYVIPHALNSDVVATVANAVEKSALETVHK